MLKAILEGTDYEMESIRRAAVKATGLTIGQMASVGGGTRNPAWMQIKADVSGCHIHVTSLPEATLLGAAMVAGIGVKVYDSEQEAVESIALDQFRQSFQPDAERNKIYQQYYGGYSGLQTPLRQFYHHNE
jgi:xylulokinase